MPVGQGKEPFVITKHNLGHSFNEYEYLKGATWHIGRKAIIAFLGPYLDLVEDPVHAWVKIRRWKRRYALPIETQPNGKPYIDEGVFFLYWSKFRKTRKKKV